MRAALNFEGKSQLRYIKAPTLILVASENKQTHKQGYIMEQHIPQARLEMIPHAHHLPNLDNPTAFNKAVLTFLAQ